MSRDFIKRYWFLTALIVLIPIGMTWPELGKQIKESGHVIPILVGIMLGIAGFTMDTSKLVQQASNFRAVFPVLASTYVLAPLAAFGLARVFAPADEPHFTTAMMIMATQAGSLASAIALTYMAGGNRELALVCTVLSSSLTVVLTPFILLLSIGAQRLLGDDVTDVSVGGVFLDEFPLGTMVLRMVLVVLLPVGLGQWMRRWFWKRSAAILPTLRIAPQLIILLFVYTGFSAAEEKLRSRPDLALQFLGACILLHVLLLVVGILVSGWLQLPWPERTAVVFCGSQKTLPNGMLIWGTFFVPRVPHDDTSAIVTHVPYGAVPLVLYHLFQLVVDTLLVPMFEKRNPKHEGKCNNTPAINCHQDE